MLEKLNLKDLPAWVIVTFAGVIIFLFSLLMSAKDDVRMAEIEKGRAIADKEKAIADCEALRRGETEKALAEWKGYYEALKKEQEAKINQLKRIYRK
jgi:predicted DNA-binding transcriptional regulator